MSHEPLTIPRLLKSIMRVKGWTRQELAESLGVGKVQLDHWLYGVKCPNWDSIVPRLERIGILSFKVFPS